MKHTLQVVIAAMSTVALTVGPSEAQTAVTLSFDSLPSAQGWTYNQGGAIPENDVFTATGSSLIQNTVGTGFGNGASPHYALFGVVNSTQPFVLAVRARVLDNEGASAFGFQFAVRSPNQNYAVSVTPTAVVDHEGDSAALDGTIFHNYVLTAVPGGNFTLYVDGTLRHSGPFSAGGTLNGLQLGDGNNLGANAHAEVTNFVFSQPATFTPPPVLSCAPSGFLPPFDTTIALNKKQQRAIPVKMLLTNGSGVNITEVAIASPVVSVEYSVGGAAGVDVTSELLPLGSANTDNIFRFDSASQMWLYNLGTRFFDAPGSYRVTATSGDTNYLIDASCAGTFVRLP